MSRRFKVIALMISTVVLLTIVAGPPLAFAVNLPTICNVFHKDQNSGKSGHCSGQTFLSKLQAKSFEGGMVHAFAVVSSIAIFQISQDGPSSSIFQFSPPAQFNPLHC